MKEVIKKITDKMLKTRPEGDIVCRPFWHDDAVFKQALSYMSVDFDKLYPDAAKGSFAWIKTELVSSCETDIILSHKRADRILLNGKEVEITGNRIPLHIKEKDNILELRCTKDEDGFFVAFAPSTVYYPEMWASDYLLHIRAVYPFGERYGEEGAAVSYLDSAEYIDESITVPKTVEFDKLYDKNEGEYAFALSFCKKETTMPRDGWINRNRAQCGMTVQPEDEVIIPFDSGETFLPDEECFEIPFLHSNRKKGDKWLFIGPFETAQLPDLSFKKPVSDKFWRFADGRSYLRAYMDTAFFGQYFYALMVGQHGILDASEILGEQYLDYFKKGMKVIADYFDYAAFDAKKFGAPTFLERSLFLDDLDSIGAVGMNLCELYRLEPDDETKAVIDKLYCALDNNIPRFSDNTFYRKNNTMWADDTYMSCPFLVRLGMITGNGRYFDECARQLKGFYERLYIEEKNIFSHIYFVDDKKANRVPWGRGNGWVFVSICEALTYIPKEHPDYETLLDIFVKFAKGVVSVQDGCGMWHQVLDMPSSYLETSCTAMFILGLARGVRLGILGEEYIDNIKRAAEALQSISVDSDGSIMGVCRGSGCSYDAQYYAGLETVCNDDHGTGIVLSALVECIRAKIY